MRLPEYETQKWLVMGHFVNAFSKFADNALSQNKCDWIESNVPHPYFNAVLNIQNQKNMDATVADLKARFKKRKQPLCCWHTELSPPSIKPLLVQHNLRPMESFTGMIFDLKKKHPKVNPPKGIQIKQLNDRAMIDQWLSPISISFEFSEDMSKWYGEVWLKHFDDPSVIHLGAFKDEQIIGTGSLFLEPDICGFYNLAVSPEYRKQGIGSYIQQYRLTLAREYGVKYVSLQASNMAKGLDEHIGFKPLLNFTPYLEV